MLEDGDGEGGLVIFEERADQSPLGEEGDEFGRGEGGCEGSEAVVACPCVRG